MLLLGTSLGSAIAVHFARQHPECVRALVMSGPQVCILCLLAVTMLHYHLPGSLLCAGMLGRCQRLICMECRYMWMA